MDELFQRGGVHRAAVELIVVASLIFGKVHRRACVLDQGLGVVSIERVESQADADGHEDFLFGDAERLAQFLQQASRNLRGVVIVRELGNQQAELIAAKPRDSAAVVAPERVSLPSCANVSGARTASESLCDTDKSSSLPAE